MKKPLTSHMKKKNRMKSKSVNVFVATIVVVGFLVTFVGLVTWVVQATGWHPPANAMQGVPVNGKVAGFFNGFLDGFICVINLILSWFNPNVSIYNANNNGGWYDLGYYLALGASISKASKKSK